MNYQTNVSTTEKRFAHWRTLISSRSTSPFIKKGIYVQPFVEVQFVVKLVLDITC